jgi:outer membrane protein assembly factor BamA
MTLCSLPLALLLLAGALPAHAQNPSPPPAVYGVIDTIVIGGNRKTDGYVILDEMTLKAGMVATEEAIQYDRNRVYSLGLFTSVDIYYEVLDSLRVLLVEVRERWYIIPVPIVGARDGDVKKLYYGAGVLHNNFQGRNQKLYASAIFGFDPAFSFSITNPMFDRENNLYVGLSLSTSSVRNRSLVESALTGDFDERHVEVGGTLGKRLSLFSAAGIDGGVHYVRVSHYRPGRTTSSDGTDLFLYATVQYAYDSRDLREYASQGSYFQVYFTKNGWGESDVDYSRVGIDTRKYTPLKGPLSLALRAHATIVSGTVIPTYARSYFGSGERLRGYYTQIWEGENLAGGTAELRYALFGPKTFVFSFLPLPPEFSIWRFGVSLALFGDTGLAWFRHDRVTLNGFASGYGGGLHFLLPYDYVFRAEYALNNHGVGEFIFDLRGSI